MTFLEMTTSGAVMILAVAVLRMFTIRRLPKGTFVALWWVTALRLLAPVELPSRFSVYTLLEALRPQPEPVTAAAQPVVTAPPTQVVIIPVQPVTGPAPEPFPVWTALWITVAAALALWFLVRYVRWQRRFRESLPVEDDFDTCLCSRRGVRLRVTDQITAPLTYGLLRPVILLPKNLDLSDEEAVTCVLAHEMAHVRRMDSLFKLVLTVALCLHWFNPAVWLLYVLANRDMELRCDEAAVLSMGEDSREKYALALIRMAELRNECVPLCGFSGRNGMEERIKAIMSIKKQSILACVLALAIVMGITTAFATSAKPMPWDEEPTDAELRAQSSAETAAQWDEVLAPYAPFGLDWKFDDLDHDGNGLTMTWEGYEVRSISDEQTGVWITEHTGNGSYGPDAVDLYTVYENGKLAGLRLATEEEQKIFDRNRALSADAQKVEALMNSVRYDGGNIYFTIPDGEEIWSIFIRGRLMTEDGMGMSVHYLEEESERAEWVPRMTYSFEVSDAAYDELTMDIQYGRADGFYDLTLLLPEGQKPMAQPVLPEWKEGITVGVAMTWPVDGGEVTNSFGRRYASGGQSEHNGVDIGRVKEGTPIYAAASGTVKASGFSAQYGNYVQLDHGNGLETFYAHCRSVEVQTGADVEIGQTIATVGSSGMSTGPHLHFGVLVNGEAQDPESYFHQNAGPVGQEGNTDLPEGTPEVYLTDELQSDAAKYYEAGSLPMFGMAFSRLSEKEQETWMDKIYADGKVSFFSICVNQLKTDSSLVKTFAEKAYRDGSVSFFSVLTNGMSEKTLNTWLDRAVRDKKTSFQSVLLDRLGREDEQDALEKELAEQQLAEYKKFGVTKKGKDYYYQGKLVNVFLDVRPDSPAYTLNTNPAGKINILINRRGADGTIAGVSSMTEAEVKAFLDWSEKGSSLWVLKVALEELVDGDYPRNRLGETYGNNFSASYLGYEPDLVAAVSEENEEGYIVMADTQVPLDSESEANAYHNWQDEKKIGRVIIPLYNSEHQEIGTFMAGIGNHSGVISLAELKKAKAQGWPNKKGSAPSQKEPIFKSIEEAQAAVANGWVGDMYGGYYVDTAKSVQNGTVTPADSEEVRKREEQFLVNGQYPVNSRGETYGRNYFADELGTPDLIAAQNDEDEVGYITKEDSDMPHFKTKEEGWAYTNWLKETKVTGWWIPLYDKEHNQIGNFLVGSGGKTLTYEQLLKAQADGWPNKKGSTPPKSTAQKYDSEAEAIASMKAASAAGVSEAGATW